MRCGASNQCQCLVLAYNRHRADGVQLFASSSLFEHCLSVVGQGIQHGQIKLALCAAETLAYLFRFVHFYKFFTQ